MKSVGEKRFLYIVFTVLLSLLTLYLIFGLASTFSSEISLSPFFPDYFSPFNASVTIDRNYPPEISNLTGQILVCENQILDTYFNVSDPDGDVLFMSIDPAFPSAPFFLSPTKTQEGVIRTDINLFSVNLTKEWIGANTGSKLYEETVTVNDGKEVDSGSVDITIIEVNNKPSVEKAGVQTIWTYGENTTFYKDLNLFDKEDSLDSSRDMVLNLIFLDSENLFNISSEGIMNYSANESLNFSKYSIPVTFNISLCIEDNPLDDTHPEILNLCGQDGSSNTVCQNFSLTVTNENRPPYFENYYRENLSFGANGEEGIYFNVSVKDPDLTVPDIKWFVDDSLSMENSESSFYEFAHTFPCDVGGLHFIRAELTDGELNASLEWNVSVNAVSCPEPSSSGGGGGGRPSCEEKWGCSDWDICQDAQTSFEFGILDQEDADRINQNCSLNDFEENCGFQLRTCLDANNCSTTKNKPSEVQYCFYTENPSCTDGYKNCHSGACEVLVDCGGPCEACATCSDGKKNQGELGTDCGGPCPIQCPEKTGFFGLGPAQFILSLIILIFVIVIILLLIRIIRQKREVDFSET